MLSSFSASSYAARSSLIMAGLSALSASGRFSVIVALCLSSSYLMYFIWSPSTEVRCALFAERRKALVEILCSAGQFQVEQFLIHGLGQSRMLAVVNGLLGEADRHRRAGCQPGQQFVDGSVELHCGRAAMDQSPVRCVGCSHLFAEQQHRLGPRHADQ